MERDENETRQVCETRSNSGKSVREEAFASRRRGLKVPTTNFSRKIKLVLKVYRIGLSRLYLFSMRLKELVYETAALPRREIVRFVS